MKADKKFTKEKISELFEGESKYSLSKDTENIIDRLPQRAPKKKFSMRRIAAAVSVCAAALLIITGYPILFSDKLIGGIENDAQDDYAATPFDIVTGVSGLAKSSYCKAEDNIEGAPSLASGVYLQKTVRFEVLPKDTVIEDICGDDISVYIINFNFRETNGIMLYIEGTGGTLSLFGNTVGEEIIFSTSNTFLGVLPYSGGQNFTITSDKDYNITLSHEKTEVYTPQNKIIKNYN